jgi:hypothetical protein
MECNSSTLPIKPNAYHLYEQPSVLNMKEIRAKLTIKITPTRVKRKKVKKTPITLAQSPNSQRPYNKPPINNFPSHQHQP